MIDDYEDRHHPFAGCFNFRDIGGYTNADGARVRWGRYFRTGRQDRVNSTDLEGLKKLGIKTQIDLRKGDEVADQGRGPLPDLGAQYVHLPVIPDGRANELNRLVGDVGISGKRYFGYLSFGPQTWLDMFDIFADADRHPIVLHCTAGKDRTGVSTAFLLTVLGMDRALIEADYLLTNVDVPRQADFIEATTGFPEGMNRDAMMAAAGVPETAMVDFLDLLEAEHGGAMAYLQGIGITTATIDKVRAAFLE